MPLSQEELIQRVARRAGLETDDARRAADAVLEVLGECLTRAERDTLAQQLPETLGARISGAGPMRELDLEQFHRRVADHERVGPGFAREHAQVVCQVVAESLDAETGQLLGRRLPDDLAALFRPRERFGEAVPPAVHHAPEPPHTVASGRPGSRSPVSEARPDRAHQESVARTDAPHADEEIATSPGIGERRERDTIATGRPGSERPLSEHEGDRSGGKDT